MRFRSYISQDFLLNVSHQTVFAAYGEEQIFLLLQVWVSSEAGVSACGV